MTLLFDLFTVATSLSFFTSSFDIVGGTRLLHQDNATVKDHITLNFINFIYSLPIRPHQ